MTLKVPIVYKNRFICVFSSATWWINHHFRKSPTLTKVTLNAFVLYILALFYILTYSSSLFIGLNEPSIIAKWTFQPLFFHHPVNKLIQSDQYLSPIPRAPAKHFCLRKGGVSFLTELPIRLGCSETCSRSLFLSALESSGRALDGKTKQLVSCLI